jgi:RNA polymerase sigma-54 factor
MQRLLDHLDLMARHDLHALAKATEVPAHRLPEMLAEIRKLNPKPGLAFDSSVAQTIVPDIVVVPTPDGGWHVELNTDTLPRVLVNARYYAQVSRAAQSKEDKEYLSERFQAANWLVKSLHQRATTILRVAREIVRLQDAFLTHGISRLKPLTLRDVASAIEMHESTVSRVTSNKYMATPRGLFELKYFFTTAIAQMTGDTAFSSESIRFRIRSLIEAEIPKRTLSDDKIVEVLQAEGIDIARRTVAKYRESMHIPSSVQRRREKLARVVSP